MKTNITEEQMLNFHNYFTLYLEGSKPIFPADCELRQLVTKQTEICEIFDHPSDSIYDIVRHADDCYVVEGIETTKEVQQFIQNDMDYYLKEEEQYFQSNNPKEKRGYQKVTEI